MKTPVQGWTAAEVRSVVLGTAGHIDHGKTALVLALTGTDTDRLPEEKARGITIDLGFAALDLPGPGSVRFDVSLIDVPGHHAFVRNMLAGAGGIDAVMLVVAADEGVKAQTVEHLQICRLLGIPRGLVVLTKRDAVSDDRLLAARGEVEQLVQGTFLERAPVVAVSALRREGIAELKAALAQLASAIPARSEDHVTRLPVDRVFTIRGFGTVVTGTLQAGRVRAGESLRLEPGGRGVRVRGVQVHGKARGEASAPNRVALNLAGVEVADVTRGQVAVPEGVLEPVSVLDATVEVLAGAPELRHRQRVRVHAFAAETLATVLLYEGSSGGALTVRLRLTEPMVLVPGDRFVLRQPSPAVTLGGGVVLDAHPLPRLRKAATAAWLETLCKAATPVEVLRPRVQRWGVAGLALNRLIAETGWTGDAVRRWLKPMLTSGSIVAGASGEWFVDGEALRTAEQKVLEELGRAANGELGRAALRTKAGLGEPVFAMVLPRLHAGRRVVLQGDVVRLPRPEPQGKATAPQIGRAAQVEALYKAAGLASPIVSEAAQRLGVGLPELRTTLTQLLRSGTLVRLGSDALLVHADAIARLTAELRDKHRGKSFDVAWFKGFTGLTRKHAIPLLEYLDGARVTRNLGVLRMVI